MRALPPITILNRSVWLPMSSGAARLLLRVLTGGVSSEEWSTAIALDPALAGWLIFAMGNEGAGDSSTDNRFSICELAMEHQERGSFADSLVWPESEVPCDWDFDALGKEAANVCNSDSAEDRRECARGWLRDDAGGPAELSDAETKKLDAVWSQDSDVERGDLASQCRAWWQVDAELGTILAGVAAKLRRASAIESDFDDVLEQSKLNAMKELAYGASHEINNPLANISSRAQTLLVDEKDPDRQRALAAINRQAFRAFEMIADLMLFAHPPRLEYTEFAVHDVIDEVFAEMRPDFERQGTVVQCETPVGAASMTVSADRVQMGVVIKALVRNSLESLGEGGRVRVSAEQVEVSPDVAACVISVMDNGPGISDEVRTHVFEPFYSGREAGRGLGFGLSKVWRIAEQHGGSVAISQIGVADNCQETCVSVHFPLKQTAATSDRSEAS